jgi:hypothetical protein
MEGLGVETAFAGDDEVGGGDASTQMHEIGDEFEAAGEFRAAEAHEAESEAASSSRAWNLAMIDAEIAPHDVGEVL